MENNNNKLTKLKSFIMRISGVISRNTIVLHPSDGGQPINISRDTDSLLFAEVEDIITNGTEGELLSKFIEIKGKIEKFSHKIFTVDEQKGQMFLKGDDQPMPDLMVEKLLELEKEGEDFMPLIRFWKKLKLNPSEASINQLYGFMVHNGIGLTESGDIVVEKGVKVSDGKLVDFHTGRLDNSIGQVVEMPRDKVDNNPESTCSYGLHVGAPAHVREYWGSDVVVKCTVNPADVVSVPVDYNNTKMRVCKYTVVGYSDEHTRHKPIFKLSEFITTPSNHTKRRLDASAPTLDADGQYEEEEEAYVDSEEFNDDEVDYTLEAEEELEHLTAPQILDYVEDVTGVRMQYNPKSKRTILKRGIEILAKHKEVENE
jgi:hypothetical protein